MNPIHPCLWFNGQAEDAAKLYTSLFSNSKIGKTARYSEAAAKASGQKAGSAMTVEFEIAGMTVLGLNGGPHFKLTPAISFFVWCESESEINEMWKVLSKDGSTLWELQKYPWAEKYGWCQDRFGVSWQLTLGKNKQKMAPAILFMGSLYGKAKEAIQFYKEQFPQSETLSLHEDPKTGAVLHSVFTLNGQAFVLMEGTGPVSHEITMATSFIVTCQTQKEIDFYWDRLTSQGGKPSQCGWLQDKFGVAWQIVPAGLGALMSGSDPGKAQRVMQAMLKMSKLDISQLEQAANQAG